MQRKIYDYFAICDKIKKIDEAIIFSGVINERGRLVAGGLREGAEPFDTPQEDERLYMELLLRARMRKEFDRQLGPVNFAMATREKMTEVSIPINEDVLYVVMQSDLDYSKIIPTILNLVK